jgi:hypothetical protein
MNRVALLFAGLAFSLDGAAATRYVNVSTGSNVGTCTNPASPCATITYAMAQAVAGDPGDTLSVAPGLYNETAGELYPIAMKSGTQLVSTGGAEFTVVVGSSAGIAFPFGRPERGIVAIEGSNAAATLIRGFTFREGKFGGSAGDSWDVGAGGAIRVIGGSGSVTIDRNIFDRNIAVGDSGADFSGVAGSAALGGAIYVSSANVNITNNVFLFNAARGGDGVSHTQTRFTGFESGGQAQGGAIHFTGSGKITNNTFYRNSAGGGDGGIASNGVGTGGGGFGGAVYAAGAPAPIVSNNIFYGNAATSGTGGTQQPSAAGALFVLSASSINANLFHVNTVNGAPSSDDDFGTGALQSDPVFHLPTNTAPDLHIKPESPANGSGDPTDAPAFDLDGVARPNPPSRGAYEASVPVYEVVTDFNSDGKSDLLWRNDSTGQVYRMLMNGAFRTNEAMVYTEPNTAWTIVGDADFDGNGVTDLLWRNSSTGQVFFMPFNAGGFPSGGAFVHTEPNPAWKIVATPDINGDGKADILWFNSSTRNTYIMLLNGAAIVGEAFGFGKGFDPDTAWRIEGVGDFSETGQQDQVLWRNTASGRVDLTSSFGSPSPAFFANSTPPNEIVAVADFNGDAKDDILWRNPNTGAVSMMLIGGVPPTITSNSVIYTEPNLAWKIVAAGDYNGDGKADILWRNDSTGMIYMMLMNGPAIVSQAVVYTEPNTAWKVLGPWEYRVP